MAATHPTWSFPTTGPHARQAAAMVADLDLTNPDHVRDPYPILRALREDDPVHRSEHLGGWVLTRYADVNHALRSPNLSVDTITPFVEAKGGADPDVARLGRLAPLWAIFNDPPDHTRLRSALNQGFTNRQVENLREFVTAVVHRLLDSIAARGGAEFVRDFAYPLPALVMARLLGVPDGDVDQFKLWSDDLGEFITTSPHPDRYARASAAMERMAEYFRPMVSARRRTPTDDLFTGLVGALDRGIFESEDELLSNCILLLFAGHETTTNLLTSGLYHLVTNSRQLERLRADPFLATTAIEELLRFDNPAHGLTRVVLTDFELGDAWLRRGDRVVAFVTAANRDPDVFASPDALDVSRHPNRHLSFGASIHYCLGAPLARLEAGIAIPLLLERFVAIDIVDEPVWKPLLVLRSIENLAFASGPIDIPIPTTEDHHGLHHVRAPVVRPQGRRRAADHDQPA